MSDKLERIGITAALTVLFAWLGEIAVPFALLVLLQLIDYATGLFAARYRSESISSYRSIRGIAKKICMWLLIAVGGIMDWLLAYAGGALGLNPLPAAAATLVCVWLMCSEVISVLENMKDIGVKLPGFLMRLAENIRSKADK
ncbi:MAG: phage holin family protein [Oscillospiraceae bacterium]